MDHTDFPSRHRAEGNARGPLLVLGLEGVNVELMRRAGEEGWLPAIGQLLGAGRSVRLWGRQELFTGANWPSLLTGTEVWDHGMVRDWQLQPGTYDVEAVPSTLLRHPPFWSDVSEAGIRGVVLDVHGAPLVHQFDGVQLLGWNHWDPWVAKFDPPHVDPPGLQRWLEERVGSPQMGRWQDVPATPAEHEAYRHEMLRGVDRTGAALIALLEREPWGFAIAMFDQFHQVAHALSSQAQGGDPDADRTLRAVLEATDRRIGTLLEQLPGGTAVALLSSAGMGYDPHIDEALPEILQSGGWLVPSEEIDDTRLRFLAAGRRIVRRVIPRSLRPALARLVPRERWHGQLHLAAVDWSRTRAFAIPSDGTGHIRVNLRGREPAGIVGPGGEYDRLCDELVAAIGDLRDPVNDRSVVDQVARVDELFDRPVTGPLPDVVVSWRTHRGTRMIGSDEIDPVDITASDWYGQRPFLGMHARPGFLTMSGPGIDGSGVPHVEDRAASLLDAAPTILVALGIDVPSRMRGRAVDGLVP